MNVSRSLKKGWISILCILLLTLAAGVSTAGNTGIRTGSITIVIDPGHGGHDTGIVSPSQLAEKSVMLSFAKLLTDRLKSRYDVFLTRSDDISMGLKERTAVANQKKADLFISLHSKNRTSISDTPTLFYFLPPDQDRQPGRKQDNTWQSQQQPFRELSRKAAELVCQSYQDDIPAIQKGCSIGAPLAVLAGAGMPALLIEPFSITLASQSGESTQAKIETHVKCIVQGIDRFFNQ